MLDRYLRRRGITLRHQAVAVALIDLALLLIIVSLLTSRFRAIREDEAQLRVRDAAEHSAMRLDMAILDVESRLNRLDGVEISAAGADSLDGILRQLAAASALQLHLMIVAPSGSVLARSDGTTPENRINLSSQAQSAFKARGLVWDGAEVLKAAPNAFVNRFVKGVGRRDANGNSVAIAVVTLTLDSLCLSPCDAPLPEGSVVTVSELNGSVVYTSEDSRQRITPAATASTNGTRASPAPGQKDLTETRRNGERRLVATHAVRLLPWRVAIDVPVDVWLEDARVRRQRTAAIVVAVVALMIYAGYRITLRSIRRIQSLRRDIAIVASGNLDHRAEPGLPDELGQLALAFNEMATAIQERDESIRSSYERLGKAQRMEALGTFSAGIAHDFNNYLHAIIVHAELAEGRTGAEADRDIASVLGAASRATALTRQILDYSRRESHFDSTCAMNEVMHGIDLMLRRMVGVGHELHVEYCDEPVWIPADRSALEQVIVNLTLNARDALASPGRVSIVIVRQHNMDGTASAVLRVMDTGTGIQAEDFSRIFDPFYTTKDRAHGTGLGLAVTFGIVERAGGTIRVEESSENGTTIVAMFPLVPPPQSPEQSRLVAEPLDAALIGAHVLVVDDDPHVLDGTRRVLTEHGYRVTAVTGAHEALGLLTNDPGIALLLSDVIMPQISGPALCAAARSVRPALPLLLMSGFADEEALLAIKDIPSAPLIRKPCGRDELLSAVRVALGQTPQTPSTSSNARR